MKHKKKVAVVVTTFFPGSHANLIISKLANGFDYNGRFFEPKIEIASIYLDQIHPRDLGIPLAKKHNFDVYQSIHAALILSHQNDGRPPTVDWTPGELNVDGVVIIGEHGDYSINEFGRQLYPRRHFFEQVCGVFDRSGYSVPVFSDKHLSYNWQDALWMYQRAQELNVPFMAGSALPLEDRYPDLQHPTGTRIQEALSMGFHHGYPNGLESYGYHCLEGLQCMVERRAGAETGILAVQCLEGEEVWSSRDKGIWPGDLAEAAEAGLLRKKDGSMEENCHTPTVFLIEYRDGFRGTGLMLPGHLKGFGYAARIDGKIETTSFEGSRDRISEGDGFRIQALNIQEMVLTGQPQYPVERTLLVTGALDALFESRRKGNIRIETPHLDIKYKPFENLPVHPSAK